MKILKIKEYQSIMDDESFELIKDIKWFINNKNNVPYITAFIRLDGKYNHEEYIAWRKSMSITRKE